MIRRVVLLLVAFLVALTGISDAQVLPPPQEPPREEPPPQQPPPEEKPPPPSYPALPANSGTGRRIVYSVPQQRVWIVEADEKVVGSWLVSGKKTYPRAGTYKVFSRSRHAIGKGGKVRMEFMLRFAPGKYAGGFHSIPVNRKTGRPVQSESELGQPRSLGCVRQRYADAEHLWNWAPNGTKVVVTR
jgi:lipoprotein-anchoring transpeptidase ErfK/SrfK